MTFHVPKKRFGQHFLTDSNTIEAILSLFSPKSNQTIIEIGPGLGALTYPLLKQTNHLQLIELDKALLAHWEKETHQYPGLTLHAGDALKVDYAQLQVDNKPLRLIGNLPYQISSPLLFHLLRYKHIIQDMLFMLQKEVVSRLVATPGHKHYGRLSVMIQYHCRTEKCFDVPPNAFSPPPKVDSSMVLLEPYQTSPYQPVDPIQLEHLVRIAFAHRRKTLANNLKTVISAEKLDALDVNPLIRPEAVDISSYVAICNAVCE